MTIRFIFRFLLGICVSLLLAFTGCQTRSFHEKAKFQSANVDSDAMKLQLWNGIMSSPDSSERRRGADALKALVEMEFSELESHEGAEQRARTRKALSFTIDYMSSGAHKTCADDEKLRLYRGFGKQALIKTPSGGMVHLSHSATSFFAGAESSHHSDRLMGTFLSLAQGRMKTIFGRHQTDSKGSFLISTSQLSGVAQGFGPGYMALDVCPQRALLSIASEAKEVSANLNEFLIPLFIFPEEITSVSGPECQDREAYLKRDPLCHPFVLDGARISKAQDLLVCTNKVPRPEDETRLELGRKVEEAFLSSSDIRDYVKRFHGIERTCREYCKIWKPLEEGVPVFPYTTPSAPLFKLSNQDRVGLLEAPSSQSFWRVKVAIGPSAGKEGYVAKDRITCADP